MKRKTELVPPEDIQPDDIVLVPMRVVRTDGAHIFALPDMSIWNLADQHAWTWATEQKTERVEPRIERIKK